jgi:hypothetical protein
LLQVHAADGNAGLLGQLASGRLDEPLVWVDKAARQRQIAAEGRLSAVDEQDHQLLVADGENHQVHGDREARVGVAHGRRLPLYRPLDDKQQNKIELARREEQLLVLQGANAQRLATDEAAAGRITTGAEAEREQLLAQARADGARALGEANAAGEAARVAAYRDLSQGTLLALAAKDLAGSLPRIGTLVLAPDTVTSLLARLGSDGQAQR